MQFQPNGDWKKTEPPQPATKPDAGVLNGVCHTVFERDICGGPKNRIVVLRITFGYS